MSSIEEVSRDQQNMEEPLKGEPQAESESLRATSAVTNDPVSQNKSDSDTKTTTKTPDTGANEEITGMLF